MSLLTSLLGSALGGANNDKTQMLAGLLGQVLSGTSAAPGAPNGVGGVIQQFEQAGLGHLVNSWVGAGANQTPTPDQVHQGLGPDVIQHMAQMTGMQGSQVTSILSQILPQMMDHVTPNGTVPPTNDVRGMLGSLLGSLGH